MLSRPIPAVAIHVKNSNLQGDRGFANNCRLAIKPLDGEHDSTSRVGELLLPLEILCRRRCFHVAIALIGADGKCSTCDSPLRPK